VHKHELSNDNEDNDWRLTMYKHKATHRTSIITVKEEGKHYTFIPGKIIILNRVRKDLEEVGIICLNPDEKKKIKKITKMEMI